MTTKKMDFFYLVVKFFLHVKYFYQQGSPCIKQELLVVKFFLQDFFKPATKDIRKQVLAVPNLFYFL